MPRTPILDDHVHLHPDGRNVEAVKDFGREGGTHLILSHLPYESVPIVRAEDFMESYRITLRLAERCRRETEVGVDVTVGPYPVILLSLAERNGLEGGVEIMRKGMEAAQKLVLEGLAVGIGEIGRPHFPVPSEVLEASNEIMSYGMQLAKEASCPVVLHTESATPESMREIALMADRVGLPRGKVVKHYCPPLVTDEESSGLFPSVLASRTAVTEALSKGTRFLMETDFLDDPSRPGAVMAITTVPKRTKAFLSSGRMSESQAYAIHQENPRQVYGIETGP
ncbi:MAG: TatD family hydrolase [Methanomassiliicoccales archaeon]|nr:TatD family hydrolase [Methanomassiliicoccales archaeon]